MQTAHFRRSNRVLLAHVYPKVGRCTIHSRGDLSALNTTSSPNATG